MTEMWTVICYSIDANIMHETSWFASRAAAQDWLDKELREYGWIYGKPPYNAPQPYLKSKEF